MSEKWEENEEIQLLREYLRIPSVHPNPDYSPCVEFLNRQAESLNMQFSVFHPVNKDNPVVVLSLAGSDPSLPSILLNSHMDVVPVFPEQWTHPPFAAHIDAAGKIFARGSQDMKSVGIQYLCALRALKKSSAILKRTIHVCFVPDEEVGGFLGMRKFVHTENFKNLNVAFSLDEGVASKSDTFVLFYAEKSPWQVTFQCSGPPGHGASILENTAGEKVNYILNKMMEMRHSEIGKMGQRTTFFPGNITSINLTKMSGGVQVNVVPPVFSISFDIRLSIDVDHDDFFKQLQEWCEEAGGGIEMEFERKDNKSPATKLDEDNIFWMAFKSATDEVGLKVQPVVCAGATDSCFLREVGVSALGFSPIINTPLLPHAHNEFIFADGYLNGIEIYKKIISKVANC